MVARQPAVGVWGWASYGHVYSVGVMEHRGSRGLSVIHLSVRRSVTAVRIPWVAWSGRHHMICMSGHNEPGHGIIRLSTAVFTLTNGSAELMIELTTADW